MALIKSIFLCTLISSLAFAAPVVKCNELTSQQFGKDVRIESATLVAATNDLREHCDVRGVIWPEAKFAVKLPTQWNERFEMAGNGGWAGTISLGAVDAAVRLGYASTSTDTGHDEAKEPGASFAYPGPNNPYALRKVIDHGFLATHETAILAKKVIRAYYGSDPLYSYWVGCSTGGKQGLGEAQRYPEDFDGYVVGAPVIYYAELQLKAVYNALAVLDGPGLVKPEKLRTLADTVLEKCDALDGLKDGLIENPLKCNFDPVHDLRQCAGEDTSACFTTAQIAGISKVYDGVRSSSGQLLFPGLAFGSETIGPPTGRPAPPRSGWDGAISNSFNIASTFFKFMAFNPPAGPNWDLHSLNVDRDYAALREIAFQVDQIIPDLSAAKMRGSKIVQYHGWSDPGVTPKMSVNYYEAAMKAMGEKQTKEFYRFFPVPGMFHCGGGPGCGNADWLSAVVNWVEKGAAPDMIVGSHIENGKTTRTRPICAYPTAARYKGSGSIDEAANFNCVSGN